MRSVVMGIGSSSHRYPSCTRQTSCLMMKMVMNAWWKYGIHNKCSKLAFSTPHNHFRGANIITTPSLFYFIRFSVSRCGNFPRSARYQYLNFMVGTQPWYVPSNTMPSGMSGVWSELFISSKSFVTLVFPFHGGTIPVPHNLRFCLHTSVLEG